MIRDAWIEHRAIREVMMFLQSHGISTLCAVRIYKEYGDNAIEYVTEDPYRLTSDFYGIGFFSSDKVAQGIGLALDSPQRIIAAIKHVLAASREFGHCYLTQSQIRAQVKDLIELDLEGRLSNLLKNMEQGNLVMVREIETQTGVIEPCYYSKSLYFDELYVSRKILSMCNPPKVVRERVKRWIFTVRARAYL
jgi:exodeoxyribonuclease V alpha subunit